MTNPIAAMTLNDRVRGLRFDEASQLVVSFLQATLPMGFWAVTRHDGRSQVYLTVADTRYGLSAGGAHPWTDSMCQHMVVGGPKIAPDVEAVPAYRTAPIRDVIPISSYVGIPIQRANGTVFGALCGLDPDTRDAGLVEHTPLIELLGALLSGILDLDLELTDGERRLERVQVEADTDVLTGLLNRRGWLRRLDLEELRCRRFGDPASVLAIDLDQLKVINDSRGHAAGDEHLWLAARTLSRAKRPDDVLARLGGDEFGLLAPGVGPEEAPALAQILQSALERVGVSASFGHAPYTPGGGLADACRQADLAMYAQKATRH